MARWQIFLLVTGGLVLAALIGFGVWERLDTPHPVPSESPSPVEKPVEKGDEYVALGDSYTSAPGTGQSSDDCLQTTTNYPHKVAAKLDLKLTDVSCGGAATVNVTAPQTIRATTRVPQGDALSPDTDLVTISLGGNDVDALGLVAYGCTAIRLQDPSGTPCQQADARLETRAIASRIDETEQRLFDVIKLVAERAPAARIVVVGYPEFFPEAGPCAQLPLADGDYAFAHRINVLLVRTQQRAAARAKVEYLDVFSASRGHDMCAEDPWIAGLSPTRADATPLHPYPEEQQLVAGLLVELLS